MSARWIALLLLGCLAGSSAVAHAKRKPAAAQSAARKLVIEGFGGEGGKGARDVVLELIAGRTDRTDYTVVGHDDVQFVAKRLNATTASDEGRRRISEELAIDLWIDGDVDAEGRGEVRLSTAEGKRLASVPLAGKTKQQANDTLRAQLWQRFGALLSPAEHVARLLQGERARAQQKEKARRVEYQRQQQLVVKRAQEMQRLLEAARVQAREKQRAREQEAARQVTVMRELRLAQQREQQRREQERLAEEMRQRQLAEEAERQRLAEEERQRKYAEQQAALQQQQEAAAYPPAPAFASPGPANNTWGQPPQPAPAYAPPAAAAPGGYTPQPAPWQSAQPAPWQQQPAPAQNDPPPANYGAAPAWSPAAQPPAPAWGQQQPAPGYTPQPAPWQSAQPAPAAAEPSEPVREVEGISPETRKWLQRKQRERAQRGR